MNKQEFIAALEKFNLPKSEYAILCGGSLLLRGLRDTTADIDLTVSQKLAEEIDLFSAPKDDVGCYVPFENCQMKVNLDEIEFDVVDGYQCESLKSILAFKKKKNRPKDQKDIAKIEEYLNNLKS
ncbi:hypothetical protein J6S46_01935 [Candidatus Saccharibacteria bacterium]|nr:hypothetical protein [Candidatus Saccharibacteria bacterium]